MSSFASFTVGPALQDNPKRLKYPHFFLFFPSKNTNSPSITEVNLVFSFFSTSAIC